MLLSYSTFPTTFVCDCRLFLNFPCLLAMIIQELGLGDKEMRIKLV